MRSFAARVIAWQRRDGRHDLPWSGSDPYRVWLSEIMLQQTQVRTVLPYYERFVARFPDLPSLARASLDDVMRLWAGLGYYSRARNLHRCATEIAERHGGIFPRSAAVIATLPGIGRSTAAAIAAFCFGERVPILEGNVKRVLVRHLALEGSPSLRSVESRLWEHAQALLPAACLMPVYTQAIMDLGAKLCTRAAPRCAACPVREDCAALRDGRTEDLPTRRVTLARPQRRAWFLVLVAQDCVLLERRPGAGIWGGLLAPPQFASARAMHAAAVALAGAIRLRALPVRTHGFSHFTLAFAPYLAAVARIPALAEEPARQWLPLGEIEAAALPAPIRGLLREVHRHLDAPGRTGGRARAHAVPKASARRRRTAA